MSKTLSLRVLSLCLFSALFMSLTACTFKKAELGSKDNPIKIFFVPSVDAKIIDTNSQHLKAWLEANTSYKYQILIPQSYIAVVEAFGSHRADVASLNTFGYILAHEKYGAEARIKVMRHGKATYQSQIIAKKGRFKDLKDLEGKTFAFVDPASVSGYILPLKYLTDMGVKLGDTKFAMKHDNVVSMIYQGQVDAGATFYSPPEEKEGIQDARRLVKAQYPDVEEKIEILKLTSEIPNDPLVFAKEMPEEMKQNVANAFMRYMATPEGKSTMKNISGVDDLTVGNDKDYDVVREMVKAAKTNPEEVLKAKK